MALTGSGLQVTVRVGGTTKALDQNGNLVSGGGFQFSSPADAVAALQTAIANNNGVMTAFHCTTAPV